ncbi:hypothetical protein DFS34DRAFT_650887 [Phlyctochytrium arcticum]|nr:hypothetical protein DFS34DRAFT_650887 [Phlyctochytrium arcticum]
MKSAGVSDSDSGSNGSNHPLQRRSPNRTSRSQGSRRLSAKTPNVPPPGKLITVQGDTGAELLRGDSALPSLFENESVFESHLGLARTPSDDAPRQSSPNYSFTFLRSASASRPRSFTRESARDPQSMTLDIGTLTGSFGIQTRATDCVRDLKRNIQDSQGISAAGQILLWQGEVLADNAMIGTIGLENGSKLRLALNMSTGSGPPLKSRKAASEDDSVVFLLCKEDDDMYMLEFHMGEGQDGHLNRKDMLRMAEVAGIEVLQELANDAHSVYVRNLRSGSYLSSQDDNRHQQKPRTPSLSRKRPTSGDTDASTSSLLSYNTPFSSNDHTPDRPLSPLSSGSSCLWLPSNTQKAIAAGNCHFCDAVARWQRTNDHNTKRTPSICGTPEKER